MHSVDKSTGVRQRSIPYILAGMGKPYDIVDVQEECPNLSNTCQVFHIVYVQEECPNISNTCQLFHIERDHF